MNKKKSAGRPARDQIFVAELKWVTPRLETLLVAEEVTIWGAVAIVMSRLGIEREVIDEYLEAINEVEFQLMKEEDYLCAFSMGTYSLDTDQTIVSVYEHYDYLYEFYDYLYEDERWELDFLGERKTIWLRRNIAIDAVEALEYERRYALQSRQLASMVFHALKSNIESGKSSFKNITVLKLPYCPDSVTVLIKQNQLGKESKFFDSGVGKVLRIAVDNPVQVKDHNTSPEYQLIGVLTSLQVSMFPGQFRIRGRPNVKRLAEFIEDNINPKEQEEFRQKRTIIKQLDRGLKASKTLRWASNPVFMGERKLRPEGVDLSKDLVQVDSKVPKIALPKSRSED
ncbi:MAG: hypothetical protein HWE12_11680 [Oceanospirillaceae bacterium]|nr:hypothetical protein [Oceanospirillaceae bacterium]